MLGEPYDPYWEVNNITMFENTIQINPSYQGLIFIIVSGDEITGDEGSILLYSEITLSYFRYTSSYGFFSLGIAVILISSYGYRRYKWK